jgi:hypothetical protein
MRSQQVPPSGSVPDPDRKVVRRRSGQGKGHGLVTAGHNNEGQEDAPEGDQECDAEHNQAHGLLTAAHNKEKRP